QARKGIENHAFGPVPLDRLKYPLGCLPQLYLGGMEQGVFLGGPLFFMIREADDIEAVGRPAVGFNYLAQFGFGFRKRKIHGAFTILNASKTKLQPKGGLASPPCTFNHIESAAGEATPKNYV